MAVWIQGAAIFHAFKRVTHTVFITTEEAVKLSSVGRGGSAQTRTETGKLTAAAIREESNNVGQKVQLRTNQVHL